MEQDELFAVSNLILGKAEANNEYPILTKSKYKRNRRREVTVGLLGLQPSRIDEGVANDSGYESINTFRKDEE